MVDTKHPNLDVLRDALYGALESGTPRSEIVAAVADTIAEAEARYSGMPVLPSNNGHDYVIFDEVPEGLITLPAAANKYNLNRLTVRAWLTRGHLRQYGRLKGAAQGGGFVLLNENELLQYLNTPKGPGRRRRERT